MDPENFNSVDNSTFNAPVPPPHFQKSGNNAMISLVCGIVSYIPGAIASVCCGPLFLVSLALAIIAIVTGINELKAINSGMASPDNRGKANAGKWLGIINIIITIIYLIFVILIMGISTLMNY